MDKTLETLINTNIFKVEGIMNKVILMGRLTRDPEVRYTAGEETKAIARYTLAVDLSEREKLLQTL